MAPDPLGIRGNFEASGQARQLNGNVYNNQKYHYTLRQRRSDETLHESQRNQAFLKAAKEGQTPRVKYLLQLGADLDYSDDEGFTALHYATLSGYEDVVEYLIDSGADINAECTDYGTALHLAALRSREIIVNLLLGHRADPNASSQYMGSPLHCACWARSTSIACILLKAGAIIAARLTIRYDYMTSAQNAFCECKHAHVIDCEPLWLSVMCGAVDLVQLLCNYHASVNVFGKTCSLEDFNGSLRSVPKRYSWEEQSPLHLATCGGRDDICRVLLIKGASVDATAGTDGETALFSACWQGHSSCVEVLLEYRASLELCSRHGATPLVAAARWNRPECVRVLLSRGAQVNARISVAPYCTALDEASVYGYLDVATVLLENGANTAAQDNAGLTALHRAVERNHTDLVRLLISHGCDVEARTKNAHTPLHQAASSGSIDAATILLDCGADIEGLDCRGSTPLHIAAFAGCTDFVRLLADRNATIDARDHFGCTPLYDAAGCCHVETVRLLIELGADTSILSGDGKTPLGYAQQQMVHSPKQSGFGEVCALLEAAAGITTLDSSAVRPETGDSSELDDQESIQSASTESEIPSNDAKIEIDAVKQDQSCDIATTSVPEPADSSILKIRAGGENVPNRAQRPKIVRDSSGWGFYPTASVEFNTSSMAWSTWQTARLAVFSSKVFFDRTSKATKVTVQYEIALGHICAISLLEQSRKYPDRLEINVRESKKNMVRWRILFKDNDGRVWRDKVLEALSKTKSGRDRMPDRWSGPTKKSTGHDVYICQIMQRYKDLDLDPPNLEDELYNSQRDA